MANWESTRPPRTLSRWQPPGIFLNVEFGVSFSPDHRTHTGGVKYTSRRMEQRLYEERIRRQHEGGYYYQSFQQPSELQQLATLGALMPGPEESGEPGEIYQPERQTRYQRQERQQRLGVRTREQHERGSSAPPTLTDRRQPVSPLTSPITSPLNVNYIPHIAPIQHTQSLALDRTNAQSLSVERTSQPLPPTPSQFRLGEEDMPWSNPPWYRSSAEQSSVASPSIVSPNQGNRRMEDPQRVREMETLHQAMMTVDSLSHDGCEPWNWEDSVENMPRGPRSIGWAVSTRDATPGSPPRPVPPPYVVSQWEQAYGRRSHGRPKSAHS